MLKLHQSEKRHRRHGVLMAKENGIVYRHQFLRALGSGIESGFLQPVSYFAKAVENDRHFCE